MIYPVLKSKKAMLAAARRIVAKKSIWADKDVFDLAHTVIRRFTPKRKGKRT